MKAINIHWAVEHENDFELLPNEIKIPNNLKTMDEISDFISDVTGYCHYGFEVADLFELKLGNFHIGQRLYGRNKFRFFYCPLASWNKEQFWFFWWLGHDWVISLAKNKYKDKRD